MSDVASIVQAASVRRGKEHRNLVICFDGTNNEFGRQNTNVVRLAQVLTRDPQRQRLYYDPGVGTLPEPWWATRAGKWVSKVCGLAFGRGLMEKVQHAYQYLMDFWEPGDRVFVFGFSRGAYAARVLAGMLHTVGLLARGNHNIVPYATRLYRSVYKPEKRGQAGQAVGERGAVDDDPDCGDELAPAGADPTSRDVQSPGTKARWELHDQFRATFARPIPGSQSDRRHFPVHFLGLWDTVSSVGWVWNPTSFPFTAWNPSVRIVRHAIAIDERRAFFRTNRMDAAYRWPVRCGATRVEPHREYWFPGVHADVGGGYPLGPRGLWKEPLRWMVTEAEQAGLLIERGVRPVASEWYWPAALLDAWDAPPEGYAPWRDEMNDSMTLAWKFAEFFPKSRRVKVEGQWQWAFPRPNLFARRDIEKGELLHRSVLLRIQSTNYAPPALSKAFLKFVKDDLKEYVLPEALPYSPAGRPEGWAPGDALTGSRAAAPGGAATTPAGAGGGAATADPDLR